VQGFFSLPAKKKKEDARKSELGNKIEPLTSKNSTKELGEGRPFMIKRIDCFILGFVLLVGVLTLPYNYYIFLRFCTLIICLFRMYWIFKDYQAGQKPNLLIVVFILSALIIFNPIMPMHMKKLTWVWVDGIYGICFLLYGAYLTKKVRPNCCGTQKL